MLKALLHKGYGIFIYLPLCQATSSKIAKILATQELYILYDSNQLVINIKALSVLIYSRFLKVRFVVLGRTRLIIKSPIHALLFTLTVYGVNKALNGA